MWKISFLLAACVAFDALATPACPEPYEAEHPDGGRRVFHLRGDEFFSWEEDAEGAVFTRDTHGRRRRASRDEVAALAKAARDEDVTAPLSVSQPTRKLLVIVVGFNDAAPASSAAFWENRFFGGTGKTVNTYFKAVSRDQFCYEPAAGNGVVLVTLASAHPNPQPEGRANGDTRQAALDALAAASTLVDFSALDANGDGVIGADELELVFILAGHEASIGGLPGPKVWGHHAGFGTLPVVNGVKLDNGGYAMVGERHGADPGVFASIGILCHELGHGLGLPDLYDTANNSMGVGGHCLMGYGCWGATAGEPTGATPVFMCAQARCQTGFSTPVEMLNGTRGLIAVSLAMPFDADVLRIPTAQPSEYFLVENRQLAGFDAGLARFFEPGATRGGIAIWHVDEDVETNNNPLRKRVDLEEANELAAGGSQLDNRQNQGRQAHYYYVGNATLFNAATTPDSFDNTVKNSGVYITVNDPPGSAMSVTVATTRPGTPTGLGATTTLPNRVSLAWQAAPLATSYNIYRSSNTAPARVLIGTSNTLDYDDPSAAAGYYYSYTVAAENDGAESLQCAPATGCVMPWPLGVAAGATNFTWTTGGHAPWFGQVDKTRGTVSLRSGRITHNQQTWLQTTVTGPGVLKFWWSSSSEPNYDTLDLLVDGDLFLRTSGTVFTGWDDWLIFIPPHTYTFRWRYSKDGGIDRGEDAGWLDAVALYQPSNTPVPVGYDWLHDFYPDIEPDISAAAIGANGIPVWHSFVAGLDPLDPKSQFTANIAVEGGAPVVTWDPDLGDERAYVVEGKTNLADSAWTTHTNNMTRFFRVKVGMP
ncbi:MAG: M6 family metalloprotease domain-containing protein [Kiritimatiellaeota bacterium]|nr:M6 family metalloprotease domain-containing protein [Kiritimatiellota bacterium]